jgi:hypothetical protein
MIERLRGNYSPIFDANQQLCDAIKADHSCRWKRLQKDCFV